MNNLLIVKLIHIGYIVNTKERNEYKKASFLRCLFESVLSQCKLAYSFSHFEKHFIKFFFVNFFILYHRFLYLSILKSTSCIYYRCKKPFLQGPYLRNSPLLHHRTLSKILFPNSDKCLHTLFLYMNNCKTKYLYSLLYS